ncbi:MAG: type II toxin-antitoxin system RelE family toxin [Candidatus Nanoarchaeia archaeon]
MRIFKTARVKKFLSKLNKNIADSIVKRLRKLKDNPIPKDAKSIGRHEGDMVFRYRIGDYRALYRVEEKNNKIVVVKIDKRPRVYKH